MGPTQASFFLRQPGGSAVGIIGRLLAILAGAALFVVGLMFSLVAVGVVLFAGLLLFLYAKWRTRHLRQQLREAHARHAQRSRQAETDTRGLVIEGEVLTAEYDTPASEAAPRLDKR
ncbi:MAG: hypothetical protein RKP46_14975 [Candidatus Accumulibacter sp.]|uniref:hypothetical protein n=1 Tax=Accumulibacter sp. TaxID=2053492 RepID=UPI0028791DC7|nr:hypothetical protein [Accumulibacter sp.]MDS4015633.1 hypothetical protein [Accumulibacter sp.]